LEALSSGKIGALLWGRLGWVVLLVLLLMLLVLVLLVLNRILHRRYMAVPPFVITSKRHGAGDADRLVLKRLSSLVEARKALATVSGHKRRWDVTLDVSSQ